MVQILATAWQLLLARPLDRRSCRGGAAASWRRGAWRHLTHTIRLSLSLSHTGTCVVRYLGSLKRGRVCVCVTATPKWLKTRLKQPKHVTWASHFRAASHKRFPAASHSWRCPADPRPLRRRLLCSHWRTPQTSPRTRAICSPSCRLARRCRRMTTYGAPHLWAVWQQIQATRCHFFVAGHPSWQGILRPGIELSDRSQRHSPPRISASLARRSSHIV